jgi:hypothetical protein
MAILFVRRRLMVRGRITRPFRMLWRVFGIIWRGMSFGMSTERKSRVFAKPLALGWEWFFSCPNGALSSHRSWADAYEECMDYLAWRAAYESNQAAS